ncbi:ubiquitin thioesterase otulin isoform X3 [Rhineura floridana]|nr:ubiquitin thioesterase otulin isoform X3 [Rhineura floridana]
MSTDKDELLCKPQDNGKATIAGDENKLSEQRSGPEKQVSTSPGITTLTDNTKQFKLSSSQAQATQESPGMSQPKARKTTGPSVTMEEKRKKGIFGIQFSKSKKEKCTPHDKMSSTSSSTSCKGNPVLTVKEDSAHCTKITQTEVSKTSRPHQDNYYKSKGKLPASAISSPVESSVDHEEDMYRDAEEIEREKILLVCGTGSSDFPENRLSVEPEVGIMDYCQEEWRGNTSHAKCIRKGYEAVSQKFISIRRVRGDNYCAIRATLFQALSQATRLPGWLQREDMILLPEKLMDKYGWITQWQLRQKWTSKVENLVDEIKKCLMLLKSKWKHMSEMKMLTEKQAACDELFRSEEDEYKLYEAVKFLMLNTAIELYEDNEKGKEVPMFSWLLFARDTSSNPSQLMKNHLNQLGLTGGLEQVEMFLLAYALQHTIQVYRMYKYNTDEFVTLYPNDPEEAWPVVTLITEDDRHYNVLARMCQETSL